MVNKKIDIFVAHHGGGQRYFSYAASTLQAKTCAEAKQKYYEAQYPKIALKDIKTAFADRKTNPSAVTRVKATVAAARAAYEKALDDGARLPNPAKRKGTAKPRRASQVTKKPPTKRLVARRVANVKPGYFPNPICDKITHALVQHHATRKEYICYTHGDMNALILCELLNLNARKGVEFKVEPV